MRATERSRIDSPASSFSEDTENTEEDIRADLFAFLRALPACTSECACRPEPLRLRETQASRLRGLRGKAKRRL